MYRYLMWSLGLVFWAASVSQAASVSFDVTAQIPADMGLASQELFVTVEGDARGEQQVSIPAVSPTGDYPLSYTYVYTAPEGLAMGPHAVTAYLVSTNTQGQQGPKAGPVVTTLVVEAGLPMMPEGFSLRCEPAPCRMIFVLP